MPGGEGSCCPLYTRADPHPLPILTAMLSHTKIPSQAVTDKKKSIDTTNSNHLAELSLLQG